jgi:hypothetical protein
MLSPEEVRLGLLSAGFTPVACIGKAPVKKAWQALHEPTEFDIKFWTQTAPAALNTGILARLAPALDIDICDPEAAAAIEALARERFEESGYFLVRGRASTSKRCIPFRTNTPFPKILVKLIPPNGSEKDVERLELLADGQQFIAHGIHPETLEPYTWHGGEPGKIKHEDLPYLHEEEARALVDDAAKILIEQFGYRLATNGSKAKTYTNGNAKPNGSGAHASSGTTDWTPDFADHDELAAFAMTLLRSGMNGGPWSTFCARTSRRSTTSIQIAKRAASRRYPAWSRAPGSSSPSRRNHRQRATGRQASRRAKRANGSGSRPAPNWWQWRT